MLPRAIASSPKDADLRREIGELFLRNGQTEQGLRWLDSALVIDPRHRATHRVLAEYYTKRGNSALARQHDELGK